MKTVSLLVVLLALFTALPAPARAQDDASWLLGQINALRASKGLSPFGLNGRLAAAAQGHSAYLANNPWTDPHIESNGSTPRSRMAAAGYSATYMGENVYGGGMATASIAYNWWLGSPVHYSGLVNVNYTEVGIGIARGTYGAFFTIDFGGGGGAAPPQPVQASQPQATTGGQADPPVGRPATRVPTRRPQPTAIPTNTPGPSLTPSHTFTPIPSKTPTETPVNKPTETPIIFELNPTDAPTAQTAVKVAIAVTVTPGPTSAPILSPTPIPAVTLTPVPGLKLQGAALDATPTSTSSGNDPIRALIPIAIGLQAIILAGVVLRRGKH